MFDQATKDHADAIVAALKPYLANVSTGASHEAGTYSVDIRIGRVKWSVLILAEHSPNGYALFRGATWVGGFLPNGTGRMAPTDLASVLVRRFA